MIDERFSKVILVLAVGWFLGYFHHHFASSAEIHDLQNTKKELNAEVQKLRVVPPMKVNVKTTAYSNDRFSIDVSKWRDGLTATNKLARRGRIAADWGVFPPGTRFYIPGYGEAVVEDRGGKIKGYHLDLFVDSREEALRWGVKDIDVYVLELGEGLREGLKFDTEQSFKNDLVPSASDAS